MEKSDCEEQTTQEEEGGRKEGRKVQDREQDKNEATIEQSHDWRPSVREAA